MAGNDKSEKNDPPRKDGTRKKLKHHGTGTVSYRNIAPAPSVRVASPARPPTASGSMAPPPRPEPQQDLDPFPQYCPSNPSPKFSIPQLAWLTRHGFSGPEACGLPLPQVAHDWQEKQRQQLPQQQVPVEEEPWQQLPQQQVPVEEEPWQHITDPKVRRRIQNMNAQRIFRAKTNANKEVQLKKTDTVPRSSHARQKVPPSSHQSRAWYLCDKTGKVRISGGGEQLHAHMKETRHTFNNCPLCDKQITSKKDMIKHWKESCNKKPGH